MLLRAFGAPSLSAASSLSRTPDTIRTVATAWTTTGAEAVPDGDPARPEAAAAAVKTHNMEDCVTPFVHIGKQRFKDCPIMDRGGALPGASDGGIARTKGLC
jgi:hypothetical protein